MKYYAMTTYTGTEYITANKKYPIIEGTYEFGFFEIIDDDGAELCCAEIGCPHLEGEDWIITEDK